jgi:predicted secreted protein
MLLLTKPVPRLLACLLLVAAGALATAGAAAAQESAACAAAPSNPTGPVQAAVGGRLVFKLDSNRTTGFGWTVSQQPDAAVARFVSDDYIEPQQALPGAGGQECFTFDAVGAGSTIVELAYRRPFEPNVAPARTASVRLVVTSAAGPVALATAVATPAVAPTPTRPPSVPAAPPTAAPTGFWLDSPPRSFNAPGTAGPPQAPPMGNTDSRCRTQEAAPSGPAETAVADAGWTLESYWPPITNGDLTLVTALADYDGMCRPMQFNVFAFVNGVYAGTLSPEPMDSRADGELAGPPATAVRVPSPTSIEATFLRYAANDPACCPSGGTDRVVYAVQQVQGRPLVVPTEITRLPPGAAPAAQVPVRLPNTGEVPEAAPAGALLGALGVALVAMGVALGRRWRVAGPARAVLHRLRR